MITQVQFKINACCLKAKNAAKCTIVDLVASAGPQTSEFKELLDYALAELEHAFYAVIISDRFQSASLYKSYPAEPIRNRKNLIKKKITKMSPSGKITDNFFIRLFLIFGNCLAKFRVKRI